MKKIDVNELLTLKLPLRFKNGRFRVLMMSDLHGGPGGSPQLYDAVEATVAHTLPDLVVVDGDTSWATDEKSQKEYLATLTEPFEKRGIPWCHIFGNHDHGYMPNEVSETVFESFPHCVNKRGDPEITGVSNYVLPVMSGDGTKPVFNVWALDSGDNMREFRARWGLPEDFRPVMPNYIYEGRDYNSVSFDQQMWYWQASLALEKYAGAKVPGIMIMHIPIPEFKTVALNREACGYRGNQGESVGCGELNTGLFATALQRGDIRGIYAGHDHFNDFSGTYCGIELGYDGGMDYDCYVCDEVRGARVFDIDENDPANYKTYLVKIRDIMGAKGDNKHLPRQQAAAAPSQ